MNIVIIVQARCGSSRLPGKVLLPLMGKPLLVRMIERLRLVRTPATIVVATTTEPEDIDIRLLCNREGILCYSGDPFDLLDRHYRTALLYDADVVVKIPSDCPLIDPAIVDRVLAWYITHQDQYDYVSNLHPPSWPDGNDVEVVSIQALHDAWKHARLAMEREHTTPYLWERPDRFRIGNIAWDSDRNLSMTHRWTIDYAEDYQFIRTVYTRLYPLHGAHFTCDDILGLLEREPAIAAINARHAGVNWYRHHLHELLTITADMTRPGSTQSSPHTTVFP
ncbi:MAG: glycosyltransferase family protein [Bacteroidetes bacterium]|nr:glycosyltransferase family protein [Bacteroidota bacterium]